MVIRTKVRTWTTDPNETLVNTYQTPWCHNPRYSTYQLLSSLVNSPNPSEPHERLHESQPPSSIEMNRRTYATPTPTLLLLSPLILVLVTFASSINPPKDLSQNLTCHTMPPNNCLQRSTQRTSKSKWFTNPYLMTQESTK